LQSEISNAPHVDHEDWEEPWENDEEKAERQQQYDDEFTANSRALAEQYWAGEAGERSPAFEMIVGPPGIKLVKKVR
jgi:hypothetical protein